MSTYTIAKPPTGPSPVRNPGIRAILTERAERSVRRERNPAPVASTK